MPAHGSHLRQRWIPPPTGCLQPSPIFRFQHLWFLRSEEHTSELQSLRHLVCRLLLDKKVDGEPFFEQNARRQKREWVKPVQSWSGSDRRSVNYVLSFFFATPGPPANLSSLPPPPSLAR